MTKNILRIDFYAFREHFEKVFPDWVTEFISFKLQFESDQLLSQRQVIYFLRFLGVCNELHGLRCPKGHLRTLGESLQLFCRKQGLSWMRLALRRDSAWRAEEVSLHLSNTVRQYLPHKNWWGVTQIFIINIGKIISISNA
jgi:hypothetical protein